MKHLFFCLALLAPALLPAQIDLDRPWKFSTGDNPAYAEPDFDDSAWPEISIQKNWDEQGYATYDGFAWYRIHFQAPASLRGSAHLRDALRIELGKIDDADAVYLNGRKIGQSGHFPEEKDGYVTAWDTPRRYLRAFSETDPLPLHWDADNVLAVRVYDGGGLGGFFGSSPRKISMAERIDFLTLSTQTELLRLSGKDSVELRLSIQNRFTQPVEGTLAIDRGKTQKAGSKKQAVLLPPGQAAVFTFRQPLSDRALVTFIFTEKTAGQTLQSVVETPYILTPPEPARPRINNADAYGARPGAPFLYAIAATGQRPVRFGAKGLPAGLRLDERTGIITGAAPARGIFSVSLEATNRLGSASKVVNFVIGDNICLTPPLGWNSWNCWGLSVSDSRVRASSDGMIRSGLASHGWTYINIDDGWEAGRDPASGAILCNEKFPDMKGLSDYVHSLGLKIGIYSSPGPRTCGGYTGTWQHETQDAQTWAAWGFDYLKYDWCSYSEVTGKAAKDWTRYDLQKPYRTMYEALGKAGRDIVYSLCQYGMGDVWEWGAEVGGNLWRTTGDITDTWESLQSIGFSQAKGAPYAHPGRWNDPDMLIVGKVGWGDQLHATRLSPSEQYTHISLWALLSAPLLIGCDLTQIDAFTYNLLANDEVLAINQDVAGKQALQIFDRDGCQVWVKELADGSRAVGIFNLSGQDRVMRVDWTELGLSGFAKVRDVWRQRDIGRFGAAYSGMVFGHGVALLRVY